MEPIPVYGETWAGRLEKPRHSTISFVDAVAFDLVLTAPAAATAPVSFAVDDGRSRPSPVLEFSPKWSPVGAALRDADGDFINAGPDALVSRGTYHRDRVYTIRLLLASDTRDADGYPLAEVDMDRIDAVMDKIEELIDAKAPIINVRRICERLRGGA